MGGNFNAASSNSERNGQSLYSRSSEQRDFLAFMFEANMVDLPVSRNNFTWFSGDGKSMSKLYRFLVDDSIINKWGVIGQSVGKRDVSDHCPN
ncbi:unnamed protein product [Lathyrus sativus]|nr:unnamed protein product [Lathyrus sativus]